MCWPSGSLPAPVPKELGECPDAGDAIGVETRRIDPEGANPKQTAKGGRDPNVANAEDPTSEVATPGPLMPIHREPELPGGKWAGQGGGKSAPSCQSLPLEPRVRRVLAGWRVSKNITLFSCLHAHESLPT